MPIRMANTGPPTKGNTRPRSQLGTAKAKHRPMPGRLLLIFFIWNRFPSLLKNWIAVPLYPKKSIL